MNAQPVDDQLIEAFGSEMPLGLNIPADGVVAVILAYNELLRFPYFLEYYRALGISHFLVVDNNSSDGSPEFLASQPDVQLIRTEKEYRDYKSIWRQLLCDRYLTDRWVIFPDVDELFVYPGWPEKKIDNIVQYLNAGNYAAMFCPMVDMYPAGPLRDLTYRPGQSFLEVCPWFDASGYRYNPLKGSHGKRYKTPARHVFGGTRERLFHQNSKRTKTAFDRLLLTTVFSLRSKEPNSALGRKLDQLILKLVKNALPSPAAIQSKIPLIKWQRGYTFSGGVHGIAQQIPVAPVWGALLHFKYLDDFQRKVAEALRRRQHTDNAGHYREYDAQSSAVMEVGLLGDTSRLFQGVHSLQDCGLVRESHDFQIFSSKNI
ncbi:hypothetical protein SIAM614_02236 [Stappia aggregata IAM 12614]|uniref:Glycosyl transferase family 2 n=1 Tax=Roseibium aggregatum (strain ATCC 25650 / DSM 13394 / JCM 20685 / NBRC 16684 / NCIMB 2208 / IAM 12614 / B1) TaxID=384765 RepID=A0NU56_ROSAI|nr:glycosyltransferase family 2 protein [Roseibium aggregatum]EAV43458.1 hypothetical protein SIAM614_02236 [Stappia aggregata IAM 12614] [Roseibium aggregatum IAM 12614]